MRDSYRLTGQPALILGARVQHAFTWVFVIQEVYSRMVGVQAAGSIWRWFVFPTKSLTVSWSVPRTDVVAPTMDTESSILPMVTDATTSVRGTLHDTVKDSAGGGGRGLSRGGGRHGRSDERGDDGVDDPGCVPAAGLSDLLPPGSPTKEVGLQRLLDWGERWLSSLSRGTVSPPQY
jgi:hypothetical protein